MDRVVRIIGVAIVVALPIVAYRSFDRAVSAEPVSAETEEPGLSTDRAADPDRSSDPDPNSAVDDEGPAGRGPDAEPSTDRTTDAAVDPLAELAANRAADRVIADSPRDVDGNPPRTLAFGFPKRAPSVWEARSYRVEGSDRADTPAPGRRRGTRPTDDSRSAYPIETELAPGFSLAPVGFIHPGLYSSTFDAVECSYELRRTDESGDERLIGHERLKRGRLLVSINAIEPDLFSSAPQCRSWVPWSPLVEPLAQAPVGDYWIGDLARGTWGVPEGCLWEKVVAFRGARLADVTDSGRGPKPLLVDEETLGVRIRDCDRALVLVEAEPDPGLGREPGLEP